MSGRILAEPKKKSSTSFLPMFGKKLSDETFAAKSDHSSRETTHSRFGHNFSNVRVESRQSFKQSCPLALPSPTYCPFGGACHTCPVHVQTKLMINQPGDKYEQEADRVADRVTHMPEAQVMQETDVFGPIDPPYWTLERFATTQAESCFVPPLVREVLSSPGEALDPDTKDFMETRFWRDFSEVRIHSGAQAAMSARSVNARAFTIGYDVVFGSGQYAPEAPSGRRLLAHELTHTIQQRRIHGQIPKGRGERSWIQCEVVSGASRSCGPDVTDWLIHMLNSQKRDRRVLEVRRRLDVARRAGARAGFSSLDVLEGGVVRKLLAAERAAGNPPRTAEAQRQIAAADPRNEFGRAILAAFSPFLLAPFPVRMMLAALRGASLIWKSLVETGGPYDFKNNVLSRSRLAAAGCPSPCPGEPTVGMGNTCYEHDLPGNIFYAYIGRYCGFSLNALQLGSQYANLLDPTSRDWDPPQDTAAINLGWSLPRGAITRGNLLAALRGAGTSVVIRACTLCPVTYSP